MLERKIALVALVLGLVSCGPTETPETPETEAPDPPEPGEEEASSPLDATGALFAETFDGLRSNIRWADGSTHGRWRAVFNGYGTLGVEALSATKVLHEKPLASTRAGETHAGLAISTATFGDLDLTVRMKTVAQLRKPAPNPWEVGWLLWHYTDAEHFYYLALKPNGWELGKEDPAYPGAQRFLATGSAPRFPIGSWHTIRVRQTAGSIEVWVDGAALTSFVDEERPYPSGAIGLYSEDAHVHFDDVVVRAPSPPPASPPPPPPGGSSEWLYGVTIDDITRLSDITTSLSNLARRPTARIVFDEFVPASDYAVAVDRIGAVSDVLGEILDSSSMTQYSVAGYLARTEEYLRVLGGGVDLWEVGNEVNGEWLGSTSDVVAKITGAFERVEAAGGRSVLTLYYNEECWERPDHEMFTWAAANIPAAMKQGLDYVLVSYYEDDCNGLQPDWPAVFNRLAEMFPSSKIGFGECGTIYSERKEEYVRRYYGMQISAPRYVGGYFWWYFRQDMVPYTNALWTVLNEEIARH